MQEVGHFGVIFFIAFIWIISIFITLANFYYFNQVYQDGGTPDYSEDSAYNICIAIGFSLGFQILCFLCVFYVIYEEYERSSTKGDLELQLERYKASINAINTTYAQTSKDISKSLKKQLDQQVTKITGEYLEKEQRILDRENEIRQKLTWVRGLYEEQKVVREELEKAEQQISELKNENYKLKSQQPILKPEISETILKPEAKKPETILRTEPTENKKSARTIKILEI